jgi:hypothetical protein
VLGADDVGGFIFEQKTQQLSLGLRQKLERVHQLESKLDILLLMNLADYIFVELVALKVTRGLVFSVEQPVEEELASKFRCAVFKNDRYEGAEAAAGPIKSGQPLHEIQQQLLLDVLHVVIGEFQPLDQPSRDTPSTMVCELKFRLSEFRLGVAFVHKDLLGRIIRQEASFKAPLKAD